MGVVPLLVACGGDSGKEQASAAVGPSGKTVELHGVTITVPAGAVPETTELSVRKPTRVAPGDAPFNLSTGTRLDISFKAGLQPAAGRPLELAIPLKGAF